MILGVVPARGGSRGIYRKNLVHCAGRPLLLYTAHAALASQRLDRVIVSTDNEEIAAAARTFGLDVPFLRPQELAADATPMLDVLRHVLDWTESSGLDVKALVLLQPTSPTRTAADIDGAVDLFMRTGAASVVSVMRVPHQFTPGSLYERQNDLIVPGGEFSKPTRRQDKAVFFARNGPAVLVTRESVVRGGSLYGEPTIGFEMSREASVDVDDELDLKLAECLLAQRH